MPHLPQHGGFGDIGDGETIHPGLQQARGDLGHPVSVGIGFHDGDIAYLGRQRLLDATNITIDGGQIDLHPSPGGETIGGGAHTVPRWRSPDQVAKSLATLSASGRPSARRNPGC